MNFTDWNICQQGKKKQKQICTNQCIFGLWAKYLHAALVAQNKHMTNHNILYLKIGQCCFSFIELPLYEELLLTNAHSTAID